MSRQIWEPPRQGRLAVSRASSVRSRTCPERRRCFERMLLPIPGDLLIRCHGNPEFSSEKRWVSSFRYSSIQRHTHWSQKSVPSCFLLLVALGQLSQLLLPCDPTSARAPIQAVVPAVYTRCRTQYQLHTLAAEYNACWEVPSVYPPCRMQCLLYAFSRIWCLLAALLGRFSVYCMHPLQGVVPTEYTPCGAVCMSAGCSAC